MKQIVKGCIIAGLLLLVIIMCKASPGKLKIAKQWLGERVVTVNTRQELLSHIEQDMEKKRVTQATYRLPKKLEADVEKINLSLQEDTLFYGTVLQYKMYQLPLTKDILATLYYRYSEEGNVLCYLKQEDPVLLSSKREKQLYEKVLEILTTTLEQSMSDYEKELALHDYLVNNCEYEEQSSDSDGDWHSAYGALVNGRAVCSGYSHAMYLLLQAENISCHIINGTGREPETNEQVPHSWNQVQIAKDWYQLDATWDDPLNQADTGITHSYFNITDEQMEQDHDWTKKDGKACTAYTYNYYVYEKHFCQTLKEARSLIQTQFQNKETMTELWIKSGNCNDRELSMLYELDSSVRKLSYGVRKMKEGYILTLYITY